MAEPTIFVATPTLDSLLHQEWVVGALGMHQAFPGRFQIDVNSRGMLPRTRDIQAQLFMRSGASHLMLVDSDIGWRAPQIQELLDTGKDVVSGVYCKRTPKRDLPYQVGKDTKQEGQLLTAESVPAGFLLISRPVIERMMGAYSDLQYNTGAFGRAWGLWYPMFDRETPYSSEDISFCIRWRRIGGEIWVHSGVVVSHYGEACYRPEGA